MVINREELDKKHHIMSLHNAIAMVSAENEVKHMKPLDLADICLSKKP